MNIKLIKNKYQGLAEPVKASIWYTICNVLIKGIALLSTPIFTRILSEEQYGTYAIFQSWYTIIIIFTSLNMFLGGYNKGLIIFKDKQEEFTSSLLMLSMFITFIFGMIYLLAADFWSKLLELSPLLMMAMFIELLTMPAIEFWAAKQRFEYCYRKYVFISIGTVIISLGLGIITVLSTQYKVEARVFSDVLAKSIFGIALFVIIMWRGKMGFNKEYWKYALKFNIPLIPHYLSTFILNQSDRIMIGKLIGNMDAAYYSVAYTISTMMILVTSAINNSLVPYIYKTIENKNTKSIKKSTSPLFFLVAFLCVCTMAFAPEVITIFAGEKYSDAICVIPPIATSVFFIYVYSMFSTIEYYFQKTRFIAISSCLSAIINIALNFIFIPMFGYQAAGYTTLISYMFYAFIHYLCYKKILRDETICTSEIYDIKIIILSSAAIVLIMILMLFAYQWTYMRYILIVLITFIIFIKRGDIMEVLNSKRVSNRE